MYGKSWQVSFKIVCLENTVKFLHHAWNCNENMSKTSVYFLSTRDMLVFNEQDNPYLMVLGCHGEPAHIRVDVDGIGQTVGGLWGNENILC